MDFNDLLVAYFTAFQFRYRHFVVLEETSPIYDFLRGFLPLSSSSSSVILFCLYVFISTSSCAFWIMRNFRVWVSIIKIFPLIYEPTQSLTVEAKHCGMFPCSSFVCIIHSMHNTHIPEIIGDTHSTEIPWIPTGRAKNSVRNEIERKRMWR